MADESVAVSQQDAADTAQLARLGYKQQLTRALGLWSNFAVGFTYLSPLVGVYSLFNYGLGTGGAAFFWSILLVLAGQALVMLTFGEVASQYPIAGGVYQWAKRLVGPKYAWLSGWMYTWALLVTITAVAFPVAGFAGPLFGYEATPRNTILTAVAVILFAALVNLAGVRRLAVVAYVGVAAEVIGTLGFGFYLLFFHANRGVGSVLHTDGAGAGNYLGAFLAAALFAVWIFYGFEACGDIAEEVKNPSRKIPRAMGLTLAVGGFATIILTLGLIVAVPDMGKVISGEDKDPLGSVLAASLGETASKVALTLIVIGFVSCTLAIQAAATRLVYSFGRDGMIAGGRALSKVHAKFHMPPVAIAVTAIIPAALTLLPSATVTRVITFAVVGIYIGFQSVVLAAVIGRTRGWKPAGAFTLGRWGWIVNVVGLAYGVAAIVTLSIKTPPNGDSFFDRWLVPISVGIVAVVGVLYLVAFRPKEQIQPEARAVDTPAEVVAA